LKLLNMRFPLVARRNSGLPTQHDKTSAPRDRTTLRTSLR
jgi:hypothetical protein